MFMYMYCNCMQITSIILLFFYNTCGGCIFAQYYRGCTFGDDFLSLLSLSTSTKYWSPTTTNCVTALLNMITILHLPLLCPHSNHPPFLLPSNNSWCIFIIKL